MRKIVFITFILSMLQCKSNHNIAITTIIKTHVLDSKTNLPLDSVKMMRYVTISLTSGEYLPVYYTNTNGCFYDTVFLLNKAHNPRNPANSNTYIDNQIIISKKGYKSDTIKIIDFKEKNPVTYYESLCDTTLNIDLGVRYLEPLNK